MKKMFMVLSCLLCLALAWNSNADKITLTVVIYEDANLEKWMNGLKAGFEKIHPDVNVKISKVVTTGTEYHSKLAMMLPVDSSIDVMWIDDPQLHNFARSNFIAPLPELKNWDDMKNFWPYMISEHMVNNEYYALPRSAVVLGFFYNKDVFRKAGIQLPWMPRTWDDIYNTAKTIKDKEPNVWPIYISLKSDIFTAFITVTMFLYGTEGGTMFRDGKWIGTSKGILDTFAFIQKLVDGGLTVPKGYLFVLDSDSVRKKYLPEGKIAMDLDGNWILNYWKGDLEKVRGKIGFAPMPTRNGQPPGYVSMQGSWMITMSAKSQHKKEALEFIKFSASPQNELERVRLQGDMSTRKDVDESNEFPEWMKQFVPYIKYMIYHPFDEQYPVAAVDISTALSELISEGGSPEDAMNKYAKNLELSIGKDKVVREYKK